MPPPTETNAPRTDAIAARLRRLLNEGMLALLAGLGSRAGWLDALAAVQPAGGAVIARAAGADEARVHAWLGALVAGRLVDFDGARETYALTAELGAFLDDDRGRAYQHGLAALIDLVAAIPRGRSLRAVAAPAAGELVALWPGLTAALARERRGLVLGAGAGALAGALEAALPGRTFAARERGAFPRGARAAFALVVDLDDRRGPSAVRLAAALRPGGVAMLAVAALSDSVADDALHPLGAFLHGARALAAPTARTSGAAPPLGARLAAAGLEVSALARVPSDPFRNYLIAHKPDSRNANE